MREDGGREQSCRMEEEAAVEDEGVQRPWAVRCVLLCWELL